MYELTLVCRGKAEHVKEALFVTTAIVPDARTTVGATTRCSGVGDGILHCAIIQPASIAPIKATFPGLKQLIVGGDRGILVQTGLPGLLEGHAVAAPTCEVWEHNT